MAIHKHFMLSCNICNRSFYDQKFLDEHYLTHNEVINTYDCYQCPKKFLQKYQLEEHLHLHNITSIEPASKKKKRVHFNDILEYRNIDDFSVNEEYSSDEDYNCVNKTTTTRSGRLVKPRKLFQNEQKVKRKYNKKIQESHSKTYINGKEDKNQVKPTTIQISNAQTVKHIHKKFGVISVEIPDTIGKEQTVKCNELRVIVKKIPDVLFKEYIARGNVCNYKTPSTSNCDTDCIQSSSLKSLSNDEEIFHLKNIQCPQNLPSSGTITINPDNSELSKKLKENNGTSANQQNVNDSDNFVTPITFPQLEQLNKNTSNNSNIVGSDKSKLSNNLKTNYQPIKLTPVSKDVISSVLNPEVSQVGNGYVYIGTNPDLKKIQKVCQKIWQAKNLSKENTKSPALETSKQVTNKISPTVTNCAVPVKHPSSNVYHKSSASNKGNLNENFLDSEEEGILDKTMLEEFLLVKVTPQYMMQKLKEQNLTLPEKSISPNLTVATYNKNTQETKMVVEAHKTISPKAIDVSSISNVKAADEPLTSNIENSEIATSNEELKNQLQNFTSPTESNSSNLSSATSGKSTRKTKMILNASKAISPRVNDISSNSTVNASDALLASDIQNSERVTLDNGGIKANLDPSQAFSSNVTEQIKMTEDQCNEIALQKCIIGLYKEGKQCTSNELKYLKVLSSKEKIFQKFIAKLKEKEHKKKEKYELKKKAKYELKKKAKYELKKKERKRNIAMKMKSNNNKSNKLYSSSKDPYSNAPTVSNENIAIRCPCNSKDCSESSLHMNSVPNDNNDTKKSCRSKQNETGEAKKKAIQEAHNIHEKFNKNLPEEEHLKLLNELNHLVTKFNIAEDCLFLSPIVRFCRLYVDSYKVKEQAVSLGKKLSIIKTN